jgi:hypothetical protein
MQERKKAFAREADQAELSTGRLHEPDLRMMHSLVEYGTDSDAAYLDLVTMGIPIIHPNHVEQGTLDNAKTVEVIPNKIIESRRSAHGVGFGSIALKGARRSTGGDGHVALKPFAGSGMKALQELAGYDILRGLGVETFDPIGVFPARHGDHVIVMTTKRPDLQSMDRRDWVNAGLVSSEADAELLEDNLEKIQLISEKLAFLHSHGVFHPDGQIKNWAITPEGEIGVIDTENLSQRPLNDPDSANHAWADVEKLTRSLIFDNSIDEEQIFGIGLFAGMSPADTRKRIEHGVLSPYIEKLYEIGILANDSGDTARMMHVQQLIDKIMEQFESNPSWPEGTVAHQRIEFSGTKLEVI